MKDTCLSSCRMKTWLVRVFFLLSTLLLLGVIEVNGKDFSEYTLDGNRLTAQEKFVLEKLDKDEIADLQRQFGKEEKDRRLRAAFLERLITGSLDNFKIKRRGVRIFDAVIEEPLDLEYSEIPYPLWLSDCDFKKSASFKDCSIAKNFVISGSIFHAQANFQRISVKQDFFLKGSYFHGPVNFISAAIEGNFYADGALFLTDREGKASHIHCNSIKVGHSVTLNKAEFSGQVNFTFADIKQHFEANEAKFFNKKEIVTLNGMQVGGGVFLKKAEFHGPINLGLVEIKVNFEAEEAKFNHELETANFNGIKVGNSVFLQDAEFHGPVDFISATIGSQINMDRSTFSKGGTFEGVKVGQGGFFLDIILKGNLVLGYADFLDLFISGRQTPNPIPSGNLDLSGTTVKRDLEIVDLKLANLTAQNLQGQGETTFKNLMIGGEALFQNSSFQTVNFINVAWGERDCTRKGECRLKVNLDGMTYHSIQLKQHEKGLPDIEGLKRLVEDSYFNFENYVQLEAYFKRSGAEEEADEVYRAGKHRQLTWRPKDICIWIFWDLLTGYGRDPWRIVWISLAIIVFGMMVFDPRYLDVENFLNSQRTYVGFLPVVMVQWLRKRCFWRSIWESLRDRDFWKSICVRLGLSLDIFVPTENPGVVDHLRRPGIPTPVFVYFFFHKLAGLTLIPLFAAAAFLSSK